MSMSKMSDEAHDRAIEAALLIAVDGYTCQGSSVEDGVCSLFLLNAPDAPHGWGVQLTARPGLVEAYFCSDGGACGTVRSDHMAFEAGEDAYGSFLRDPVKSAKAFWASFSDFETVTWRVAGLEYEMLTA